MDDTAPFYACNFSLLQQEASTINSYGPLLASSEYYDDPTGCATYQSQTQEESHCQEEQFEWRKDYACRIHTGHCQKEDLS